MGGAFQEAADQLDLCLTQAADCIDGEGDYAAALGAVWVVRCGVGAVWGVG